MDTSDPAFGRYSTLAGLVRARTRTQLAGCRRLVARVVAAFDEAERTEHGNYILTIGPSLARDLTADWHEIPDPDPDNMGAGGRSMLNAPGEPSILDAYWIGWRDGQAR